MGQSDDKTWAKIELHLMGQRGQHSGIAKDNFFRYFFLCRHCLENGEKIKADLIAFIFFVCKKILQKIKDIE